MDSFIQMLKDLAGPGAMLGGVGGLFIYFRKSERELRDEVRSEYARLREERDYLRSELMRAEAENDSLRAELRRHQE